MKKCSDRLISPTPARLPPKYIRDGLQLARQVTGVQLPDTYMLIQFVESKYNNCYNDIGFGGTGQVGVSALLDVLDTYPYFSRYAERPRPKERNLPYWRREGWSSNVVVVAAIGFAYLYICEKRLSKVLGRQPSPAEAYAVYQIGSCWKKDGNIVRSDECIKNITGQARPFRKARTLSEFRNVTIDIIEGRK